MEQTLKYSWIELYKYILREDFVIQLHFYPAEDIITDMVCFYKSCLLVIKAGFMWDGSSGPTTDMKCNMRGGIVHDALYYLHRKGLLHAIIYRDDADRELHDIIKFDGMSDIEADLWFAAVRLFADNSAVPSIHSDEQDKILMIDYEVYK